MQDFQFLLGLFLPAGAAVWAFLVLEGHFGWSEGRLAITPLLVTLALLAWTMIVSPWSGTGAAWATLPAAMTAPAVLTWHGCLLVVRRASWPGRAEMLLPYGIYLLCHLVVFLPVWLVCLMLITKDSL